MSHVVSSHAVSQEPRIDCHRHLSLHINVQTEALSTAQVVIPQSIVSAIYRQAATNQQDSIQAFGFNRGNVPIDYIEKNFKEDLTAHVRELLFKYCVLSFLYQEARLRQLVIAGEPRLVQVDLHPEQDAVYHFELTLVPDIQIAEWRYFPFKAPKRKQYKDLDRQVEQFIKEETERFDQTVSNAALEAEDWVNFNLTIVHNEQPIVPEFTQNFWFKIGFDETDHPLRELFIGKKVGDRIYTTNDDLQHYFSDFLDTNYTFEITITDAQRNSYFCFDQFKEHFELKTMKDMQKKLIEVFSHRNDISLRRMMVEEAFKVLLHRHKINIPNHLVLRQQKMLLDTVYRNPDYHVYKKQPDFRFRIRQLAKRQAEEGILINRIAVTEKLNITHQDVKRYLNLTIRQRTREFIYFRLPSFKIQEQEVPIPTEEIMRTCLREKAINHVIYHLTKE